MRKIEDMFSPMAKVWRVFSVQDARGFGVRVLNPNTCHILGEHQLSKIQFWGAFDSPGQAQQKQQEVWAILGEANAPKIVKFGRQVKNKFKNMGDTDKKVCIYTLGSVVGSFSTAMQMALKKR